MDDCVTSKIGWLQGCKPQKLHVIDIHTACCMTGNFITFLNLVTGQRRFMQSPGSGIGVLTANASYRILAFSEQRLQPCIFLYSYPNLQRVAQIRGTAKVGYSCLALSSVGPYLACCSTLPDYTLTVWNWTTMTPVCSQSLEDRDISTLTFNPLTWLQMCGCSNSSLTVWNIERCGKMLIMSSVDFDLPTPAGYVTETSTISAGSDRKLSYFGPTMPVLAMAGLCGDDDEVFVPKRRSLHPCTLCWTSDSHLYVGCEDGHLLRVSAEHRNTTLLSVSTEVSHGSLRCLLLLNSRLFAAGDDSTLRLLSVSGQQVHVVQSWQLQEPITHMCHSQDYLLLCGSNGSVYRYGREQVERLLDGVGDFVAATPLQTQENVCVEMDRLLDGVVGEFVAATPLQTQENVCVSVTDCGDVRLWDLDTGFCIASLALQTKVTTLSCSPAWPFAAVGLATGHVLFIDLTCIQKPQVVQQHRLHRVPMDHLSFDDEGNFLVTVSSEPYMFVLDARPLKKFQVLGYTEVEGFVISISTQYHKVEQRLSVLILYSGSSNQQESCHLLELQLCMGKLTGLKGDTYGQGNLSHILQTQHYELAEAVCSVLLGPSNKLFTFCSKRKSLQRFQLTEPQGADPDGAAGPLVPEEEAEGDTVSPVHMVLYPQEKWLALVGKDGQLSVWDTERMECHLQVQCHSYGQGGARSVCFSADGASLVTVGTSDGSIVCVKNSLQVSLGRHVRKITPPTAPHYPAQVPAPSDSDNTWQEFRLEKLSQEENKRFSKEKKDLQQSIHKLRDMIKDMIQENELLPDLERLDPQEFNLDMKGQQMLQTKADLEVAKVRNEIELEILTKRLQWEVLKQDCWDVMKVKGRAIKAFHTDHEVMNYSLRERTEVEQKELQRVQRLRDIEQIDRRQLLDLSKNAATAKEDGEEEEDEKEEAEGLTSQYHSYLYSQFDLHFWEQKIIQIILLQDVIYQLMTAFNEEFEQIYIQKQQELSIVLDRNKRVAQIMAELGLQGEIWEPTLGDSEKPELVLQVHDWEIKAEKYRSPEQLQKEEYLRAQQQKLIPEYDIVRERALMHMMGGVLQLEKEDILKMEIPKPEFISKPEEEWTEEERRLYKDYEKKDKELREEQEKHRKTLDGEMKKLQTFIMERTHTFDEALIKLFEQKIRCEMVINQEELKIANLVHSVLIEEELLTQEKHLIHRLDKTRNLKNKLVQQLRSYREEVDAFQEKYDNSVAEDKLLERGFRKEFPDVSGHTLDQLFKLYKRRPRIQRIRTQVLGSFAEKQHSASSQKVELVLSLLADAMQELDSAEYKPEGLDSAVWERFCDIRRTKVISEQQLKQQAVDLADMQAFIQSKLDEEESLQVQMKNITEDLSSLGEDKLRFRLNVMVQILLKQGQLEVEANTGIPDFCDSLLIHRSVVEDLNGNILELGKQKIASMVERKDFRKGIIQQEWEHRRMGMQIEDLQNKARDIQRLHLTQELQEFLLEPHYERKVLKQVSALERGISLQEQTHTRKVQKAEYLLEKLKKKMLHKKVKNKQLDSELADLSVTLGEMKVISNAKEAEKVEGGAQQRYRHILHTKKLQQHAQEQAQELLALRVEAEQLRMKSFPMLTLLHHQH